MLLDLPSREIHRIEGFLPTDDLLSQLELGLANRAFGLSNWVDAANAFQQVAQNYPKTDAAPEALYWTGVSRFKANGNPSVLGLALYDLKQRYPQSSWTKRASVWEALGWLNP
jgi:TolA-binding protein